MSDGLMNAHLDVLKAKERYERAISVRLLPEWRSSKQIAAELERRQAVARLGLANALAALDRTRRKP